MPGSKDVDKALRSCHWTLEYITNMIKTVIIADNEGAIYDQRTD